MGPGVEAMHSNENRPVFDRLFVFNGSSHNIRQQGAG
jgi:hypothetical protein